MIKKNPLAAFALIAFLVPALTLSQGLRAEDARVPLKGLFKDNFILLAEPLPGPKTPVKDLSGSEVRLSDYRGKVLLVNFWATWCAPCVAEMPSLERLQRHFAKEDFRILAISLDRNAAEKVPPFLERLGLEDLEILIDPRGRLSREMVVSGLPTTFLLDRDGRVLGGLQGPAEWDGEDALALVEYFLSQDALLQNADLPRTTED